MVQSDRYPFEHRFRLLEEENRASKLLRVRICGADEGNDITNPPDKDILREDVPTDEDFCRVDTNSENETRSELTSVDATGEDDEDAADSHANA
ncbi:hypothetical protein JG687_00013886 [Phytophthora cactorum]|uniref:Uncharacterized protein n=1 Tax=Phytophthora cactorum TaxID=29920 RepID=A0A8T1TY90_9STRA|nr:hypothetical protein JG687_00013886 [Phytophthora cactorum]